jgi:hypothetical protein
MTISFIKPQDIIPAIYNISLAKTLHKKNMYYDKNFGSFKKYVLLVLLFLTTKPAEINNRWIKYATKLFITNIHSNKLFILIKTHENYVNQTWEHYLACHYAVFIFWEGGHWNKLFRSSRPCHTTTLGLNSHTRYLKFARNVGRW